MEDYSASVMIALLPTSSDWCKIDLPHMTLVFAGDKEDLSANAFNELAKDASALSMLSPPLSLKVVGTDVFGDEEKVDVLRLEPTSQLLALRRFVERWDVSEHPFNPHCTIGPAGTFVENLPMYLTFDRVCVEWGDEPLVFWLKTGY